MKTTNTLIIGASAAALGMAARLGGDCLVIERGWSACREFADAMRADRVDMAAALTPYAASVRDELLARNILSEDGRLHVLALGGVIAKRFLETGCGLLLGTSVLGVKPADGGFDVTVFEGQTGRSTIRAAHVIDTTVNSRMDYRQYFSVMLAGNPDLAESEEMLRGLFPDEFIARFELPAMCDLPTAQAFADAWLMSHRECKAASVSLEFARIFDAPLDETVGGVRYFVSDSFHDVIAAIDGGARCQL